MAEQHRNEQWDLLRGDIPNGALEVDGHPVHGLTVCNVPAGSQQYVVKYLRQRLDKITSGFIKADNLLYPGRWPHPEIPSRQMLWILTLVCFQSMGDYWLRHVRPDWTRDFEQGIDEGVQTLLESCVGMPLNTWSEFVRERL